MNNLNLSIIHSLKTVTSHLHLAHYFVHFVEFKFEFTKHKIKRFDALHSGFLRLFCSPASFVGLEIWNFEFNSNRI